MFCVFIDLSLLRIVVLAGDTLPIDVYCHLPVMCEDRNLPYAYIPSKVVSLKIKIVLSLYVIELISVSGWIEESWLDISQFLVMPHKYNNDAKWKLLISTIFSLQFSCICLHFTICQMDYEWFLFAVYSWMYRQLSLHYFDTEECMTIVREVIHSKERLFSGFLVDFCTFSFIEQFW